MATVPGVYQIGIDLEINDQNEHDRFGTDAAGHLLVSGGHLTELTRQMQNGVLRIDNAPRNSISSFGPNGGAAATVYRQCAGPQATRLLAVNNLDNPNPGRWLWVKSGKQAAH
jgi:hypothetical protein